MPMKVSTQQMDAIVASEQTARMKAGKDPKCSVLKEFPTAICRIARREFPDARTNTDAIVAYMYIHCPELLESQKVKVNLSDDQWALITSKNASAESTIQERLVNLQKKDDKILSKLNFDQVVSLYMLYCYTASPDKSFARHGISFDTMLDSNRFLQFVLEMENISRRFLEFKTEKVGRDPDL